MDKVKEGYYDWVGEKLKLWISLARGYPPLLVGDRLLGLKACRFPRLQQLLSQLLQGGGPSGEEIPLNIFFFMIQGFLCLQKSPPLSNSAWYFPGDSVALRMCLPMQGTLGHPWSGRIPRLRATKNVVSQLLSLGAELLKLARLEPVLCATREAITMRNSALPA